MTDRSYCHALPYGEIHGKRRPALPVQFTYLRTTQTLMGLVDSGAERSLCSETIARETGIDPRDFPFYRVRGVSGSMRARLCPIDLHILGQRIATEILVVDQRDLILLGRRDVFRAFQFGIDERAELLLVEPY